MLTREEIQSLFASLDGVPLLVCSLLYGAGLRLFEGVGLRVKDLEFQRHEILVRDGKGQKDCVTMLPHTARQPLLDHLQHMRALHQRDLARALGRVPMRDALARKYSNASGAGNGSSPPPAISSIGTPACGTAGTCMIP